ncbi:hypothetical protein NKR19_g3441 [Coniochaeta hoffmannii]|uniref:Uncharacterized protein n=1 Tax=Coniochaeta hoffmannii TaxID=91930 RepID=A0AA38W1F1_9PEZI|nr:hypothetical protein NKR19_g3441 [Coniochaeta hoffmannii]
MAGPDTSAAPAQPQQQQQNDPPLPPSPHQPPRPHQPAADDDSAEEARALRTQRAALQTRMPERSERFVRILAQLSSQEIRPAQVVERWQELVAVFWEEARADHAADPSPVANRDKRDFAAVANRTIDSVVLETTLPHVYAGAARANRDKKQWGATFERARNAVTKALQNAPGARDRHVVMNKWMMYLFLGRAICAGVNALRTVSALLQPKNKAHAVGFPELTRRLTAKMFAEKGNDDEYPEPTTAHLYAVEKEVKAEAVARDDAADEERAAAAQRRMVAEQAQAARRARGAGGRASVSGRRGSKRLREEDEEEAEDEDDGRRGSGGGKRRRSGRSSAGGERDEDDDEYEDNETYGPEDEDEASRALSARSLDQPSFLEPGAGADTLANVRSWLAGNARRLRDMAGPADPDGILPDNMRLQLEACRLAVQAYTARLHEFEEALGESLEGAEGGGE